MQFTCTHCGSMELKSCLGSYISLKTRKAQVLYQQIPQMSPLHQSFMSSLTMSMSYPIRIPHKHPRIASLPMNDCRFCYVLTQPSHDRPDDHTPFEAQSYLGMGNVLRVEWTSVACENWQKVVNVQSQSRNTFCRHVRLQVQC